MRLLLTSLALWSLTASLPATADELDAILHRLDVIRAREGVPAYALVLVKDNGIEACAARGLSDLVDNEPVSGETRFRIGSITKTFTAMAMLIAARDGTLDFDVPISELVTEPLLRNPLDPPRPVTVAQLLEHSAGLQDWITEEWDLNEPLSLAAALAYRPDSRTVRWKPGMFGSYSNNGAGVAARVLELRTDRSYEEFMEEHVFGPLGMATASLMGDGETLRFLATAYDTDGRTIIPYWHVIFRPSAAISLQPCDMAPLLLMLINGGSLDGRKILDRAELRRMETPATTLAARHGLESGYGLGLRKWQHEGHLLFGHGGDADGYLSHFGYSRESGRGYFLVINVFRHRPLRQMRDAAEDWVVSPLPSPATDSPGMDPATAKLLTGRYREATPRFPHQSDSGTMLVEYQDGVLSTRIGNTIRPLIPVVGKLFRRPGQSRATAVFLEHDGRSYLIGDFGNFEKLGDRRRNGT